jgi:hypothetical protein
VRPIVVALVAVVLLLGGCRDDAPVSAPVGTPSGAPVSTAAGTSTGTSTGTPAADRPSPHDLVTDPHATLTDVSVRLTPDGLRVRAWWILTRHHRTRGAIVTSHDGMRTASYTPGTYRAWSAHEPQFVTPSPAPGMRDLLPTDVYSLRDGTRAQQGGGDGATLNPFQRLVRSVGGGPWERFDVPQTRGQQAYTSGQVVLPDGRLLALLDAWSGDRRGRPSALWHGLWISDGDDWASFRPWRPRFTPSLPKTLGTAETPGPSGPLTGIGASLDPMQARDPVVWVTTADRLYVSSDGARTFQETPARPS